MCYSKHTTTCWPGMSTTVFPTFRVSPCKRDLFQRVSINIPLLSSKWEKWEMVATHVRYGCRQHQARLRDISIRRHNSWRKTVWDPHRSLKIVPV